MGTEKDLRPLNAIIGTWTTDSTHPQVPSTVVHGTATIEWLEGEQFLIWRWRMDHPDFPDSISVIGDTDGLKMHYFDSRGVYRIYEFAVTEDGWQFSRETPEFSQRYSARIEEGGNTMTSSGKMSQDGGAWEDDLSTVYRRS